MEFHHSGVFKASQDHDGVSNQNSPQREQQQDQQERKPKKEEKTKKSKREKKTVTMKMFSIAKAAAFFLLASQGVTCSENADDGPIIGKSPYLLL